jgi:hypothetical protein
LCVPCNFFSSNIYHHGSGSNTVDSAPSQEAPYLSFHKDLKLIASSILELWCCKVGLPNRDAAAVAYSSSSAQQKQQDFGCVWF